MSDFHNKPPNDEWIRSLYRSRKDSNDEIPESISASIDASILEEARLEKVRLSQQKDHQANRWQSYRWIYGTAASAVLGILLILQIPESEVVRLPTSELAIPHAAAPAVEDILVSAQKATIKIDDDFETILPASKRLFSTQFANKNTLAKATLDNRSRCIRLKAHFTDTVEEQVILRCQTDTQLSFQFEKESDSACKKIFRFTLKSTATALPGKRDLNSGLQEIQIDHAGKLYSLRCLARRWELALKEQP